MGYPAVATIQTPGRRRRPARRAPGHDRRRGRRQGRARRRRASKSKTAAVGHGPRAARRLLGGRRRALALHRGHHDAGSVQPCPVSQPRSAPTPARRWSRRGTTPAARSSAPATCSAYLDTDVTPVAPYLYHVPALPPGRRSDGRHADAVVHPHRGPERRRRADRRQEVGRQRRPAVPGRASSRTSTPTTWIRRRATSGSPTSPREYPNISQIYDLPNKTPGYQRKAQTVARHHRRRTPARRTTRRPRPTRPQAVVV